jgi:hypothetical protein
MASIGVAAALYILSTQGAAAYLDPGTGAMVVQAIIGAIVVALVTLRSYWQRLKTLPRRLFSRGARKQ